MRRQEREREEQVASRGANLELRRMLAERFHKPKLTKRLAWLLALLVLDRDDDSYAARRLRYIDPKVQQVEVRELKSGARREKVSYADRTACGEYLIERLDRARSAEELLGVLVQTLIAAHFADEQVTAKPHRIGFQLPGSYGPTTTTKASPPISRRGGRSPSWSSSWRSRHCRKRMREHLAAREDARRAEGQQEQIVGRDAEGRRSPAARSSPVRPLSAAVRAQLRVPR